MMLKKISKVSKRGLLIGNASVKISSSYGISSTSKSRKHSRTKQLKWMQPKKRKQLQKSCSLQRIKHSKSSETFGMRIISKCTHDQRKHHGGISGNSQGTLEEVGDTPRWLGSRISCSKISIIRMKRWLSRNAFITKCQSILRNNCFVLCWRLSSSIQHLR